METHRLELYVMGQNPTSQSAFDVLHAFCERELADNFTIEMIDVEKWPELAAAAQIIATPTLVRWSGEREWRVVGDLTDVGRLMSLLGFEECLDLVPND